MLVNLAVPHSASPSGPRSLEMAFYAPTQPEFLFTERGVRIVCQPLRRALALHWSLCRNLLTPPLATGTAQPQPDNSFALAPEMGEHKPGFYDLRVRVTLSDGQTVEGMTTFGWRALEETLWPNPPSDFDAFWRQAQADLPNPANDLRCTTAFLLCGKDIGRYNRERAALPERYDPEGERYEEVEVSRVDFPAPGGGRVFGWFAKPPGPDPFPALLVLPGAGNGPRPAPVEHARHGYAALDVQIHGFPVDRTEYPPLPEPVYGAPRDAVPYTMYRNALQSVRALRCLPGADPDRLAVVGGSQGGRLSIVTAALDSRVRAAIPAITEYGSRPWRRWAEGCNREGDAGVAGFEQHHIPEDAQTEVQRYFDTAHFAPLIRCPVLMNAGLIDPVSPPTEVFAIYRRIDAPKEIVLLPNLAHDWSPAFDRYAWRWLSSVLGE